MVLTTTDYQIYKVLNVKFKTFFCEHELMDLTLL